MTKKLEERFLEIEALAKTYGLDPFPVYCEMVPREMIWETASYGLPTRMSHWSFGRSYLHQKTHGEMGYSKIYELVINNDPSYALLDETNPDVINLLICAHVLGHSDFFKNNSLFKPTNRNMINKAEHNAHRIEAFKETYGIDVIEDFMDVGFALDRHIDWGLGEHRERYPIQEHAFKKVISKPYADLFGEDGKPSVVQEMRNSRFPPHPERDILWFLINYADMLPWQREVLSMIREESFYFYPQMATKIIDEGFASFWHAELMLNYDGLTDEEYGDFAKAHSGVVSPGRPGSTNPYYIGFRLLTDIRERWDKYHEEGKKDEAFLASGEEEKRNDKGEVVASRLDGLQKIMRVRAEEDDTGFVRNYLTQELAEDMQLYTYGHAGAMENPDEDDIILKDRKLDRVVETMMERTQNYGAPNVVIDKVGKHKTLRLRHLPQDRKMLDPEYAQGTLKYINKIWKNKVELETYDKDGRSILLTCSDGSMTSEEGNGDDRTVRVSI